MERAAAPGAFGCPGLLRSIGRSLAAKRRLVSGPVGRMRGSGPGLEPVIWRFGFAPGRAAPAVKLPIGRSGAVVAAPLGSNDRRVALSRPLFHIRTDQEFMNVVHYTGIGVRIGAMRWPPGSGCARHERASTSRSGTHSAITNETGLLVPQGRIELPTSPFIPLRLSPPRGGAFVVWTIPSPAFRGKGGRRPSSLYTVPPRGGLGSGSAANPQLSPNLSGVHPAVSRRGGNRYQGCALPLSYCGNAGVSSSSKSARPAPSSTTRWRYCHIFGQ